MHVLTTAERLARLVLPAEGDTPQSSAEAAVQHALDVASPALSVLAGAALALAVAVLLAAVAKNAFRRSRLLTAVVRRIRGPEYVAFLLWGAWAGMVVALADTDLSALAGGTIVSWVRHGLLILAILATARVAHAALWVIEDAAQLRQETDAGVSRRFETQAQVLRRLGQVAVVIIGICIALFTFPEARHAASTLLASAGIVSVVAGLAAQSTLGNVFAGLQLAFTDAIRVGDVVVAGPKGDSGAIEEITLSYVVVRVWDERRLVIPSTYFTTNTFENWTRRAAKQLGTVELQLDWEAPLALIRAKVEELLTSTDLWDGRTWAVQVSAADKNSMTVRVLVSAENSGALWDLRCYLRESLIHWIATEEPWVRPVERWERREVRTVEHDPSRETVARLAAELSGIAADATNPGAPAAPSPEPPKDAVHAARLTAARQKAKKARRRAMAQRQRDLADGTMAPAHGDTTQLLSATEVRGLLGRLTGATTATGGEHTSGGRGERLYSGSPEAEERGAIFSGPGEAVIAEREAAAQRAREEAEASAKEGAQTSAKDGERTPVPDPAHPAPRVTTATEAEVEETSEMPAIDENPSRPWK